MNIPLPEVMRERKTAGEVYPKDTAQCKGVRPFLSLVRNILDHKA
jgi:hypothetical protein